MKFSLVAVFVLMPSFVFAWGGKGHHAICEAAVHLVKNDQLKEFLLSRGHTIGHLCNLPDTEWRSLDRELTKHGDPTHYINPEILGLLVQDVPTDLSSIIEKYTNKESATDPNKKLISIPFDMGTSWWRADQFARRATQFAKDAAKAEPPANSKQAQDYELPYNKAVYEMIVAMGVLGHPVGDNSQPLHNTTDYDGWANNQGGLHSYYEERVVTFFGPNLQSQIVERARKMKNRNFLNGNNTVEKMKRLSIAAVADLKSVQKADPIIKNSQLKIEKGMSLKTPAERQPPEKGLLRFQKLIVEQMARSALLLANLWDEAYTNGGSPDLKPYRSYQYPYMVPFIMPDYYDVKSESKK